MRAAQIFAGGFAFDIADLEINQRDNEQRCSFTLLEDDLLIRCGRRYDLRTEDGLTFAVRIDGMIYTRHGTHCSASCKPRIKRLIEGPKRLLLPATIEHRAVEPPLVMVVDDDEDIRVSLRDVLETSGFLVESAPHGLAALQLMKNVRPIPSLVVLDLMMPEMDGWAFREAQKADQKLRDIPVVAITAAARDSKPIDTKLLLKPFDIETLMRVIRSSVA